MLRMIRLSCHAMLLAALAVPAIHAQVRIPPPPTNGRVAFSVREAPENLVYPIFFRELLASQKAADDARDKGKDDTDLRTLFRHAFGLTDYEHQALVSAAQECVATLGDHLRTRQELIKELKQGQDKAGATARLIQLQAASDTAVAGSVQQLRFSLSPARFTRLDLMIRVRVVPRLRVVRGQAPAKTPSGGY